MADRASRKKRITAERRSQIMKAATEVFTQKGFAAATIPEIAGRASIAVGTVYLYFPNKRELFVSVIKNIIINAPLLDLIYRIPRENISFIFKHIIQNRLDLIESEEMSHIPSLVGEVVRDAELKAVWSDRFFKPLFTQFEGLFRAMQPPGKTPAMEPAVAVRAVGGFIIGFLLVKLLEGDDGPLNELPQEKVATDLAEFMLHGLTGSENKGAEQEGR